MNPIVISYTDEELIRHLEDKHPEDLAMVFTEGHRRFSSRRTWDVYHDHWLHRAKPGGADHEHGQYLWTGWERDTMRTLPGWKQMSRCTCLQPPTHQDDCPGRKGVVVLSEENTGPSAREKMWQRLDAITDGLKATNEIDLKYAAVPKAEAAAIAWCLALLDNPSEPDTSAIRKESMKRWRERNNAR